MALKMPDMGMPSWLRMPGWLRGGGSRRRQVSFLAPGIPPVAFDVGQETIAMVRLGRRKQERFIASYEVRDLPADLMEIDFYRAKLKAPDKFRELLAGLLEKEEVKFSQASLLLPDSYARVAILTLDDLPRRRQDALTILRWKTKKAVPFKVEDAAMDYMILPGTGPQVDVLAVLTPRSVVEGYERVFGALGIHAGLIQLSSLSLLNLYRPILEQEISNGSEFMVANVSEGFVTFIVFRGQKMVFFRSKPFALGLADGGDESSIRIIKRELQTSLLYYREKLEGRDLARVYLRVVGQKPEKVAEIFTSQPEISGVDWIDPRKVVDVNGRMAGEQGSQILQRLAPALGATLGGNRS